MQKAEEPLVSRKQLVIDKYRYYSTKAVTSKILKLNF